VRGSIYEWPSRASSALDVLLSEIQFASDQRSHMDTLIRSYAAQDTKTGLNNRLFFDNQLATLLEDQEKVGAHGVVMMIRLPDFDYCAITGGARPSKSISLRSSTCYPHLLCVIPARCWRAITAAILPCCCRTAH
jgi:hypothetical protein